MKKYFFLLLLFNSALFCKGQPNNLKFDHFTVKDGLPETTVLFIQQDDQGYIWIGTENGVLRYDGYTPKVYRFGLDNDAISQNCAVISMVTDDSKNLWFSTEANGLFKYNRSFDGFTRYKYPQNGAEKKEIAQHLYFAGKKGDLWGISDKSGDGQSVVKFNQQTGAYEFFGKNKKGSHYLNISKIHTIFKSADAHVWLGTNTGLYIFNEKENAFHPYPDGKDSTKQCSIYNINEAPSEPGVLWVNSINNYSKRTSIIRFDTRNKIVTDFRHDSNPFLTASNDSISDVCEDKQHRLWFASNNGLMLFNRKTETFTRYLAVDTDKETGKNQLYGIREAKNGSLWLLSGKGLLNFDPAALHFQRYTANPANPDALAGNAVGNLLLDRSGALWITIPFGAGMGLDRLNTITSSFVNYTEAISGRHNYPLGDGGFQVKGSADGYVWFGNREGVYKWKARSPWFKQVIKTTIADGHNYAIAIGINNTVYFGNSKGLQVYDTVKKKLTSYSFNSSTITVSNNNIECIMQDHTGLVWLGTRSNGICTFDPASHRFKPYPYTNSGGPDNSKGDLNGNWVINIYEDGQGTIWAGTVGGGLCRFDRKTGRFKSYLNYGHKEVKTVTQILEGRDGKLWAGTYLGGLFEFDRKTMRFTRNITEDNGLSFNTVTGIKEDGNGFLWICSGKGLSRLNPKNMSIKTFPLNTILPGGRLTYSNNFTAAGELMVMATINGAAAFNPAELGDNPYPPIVHIEKIGTSNPAATTDSVETRLTYGLKNLVLPYNQNRILFSFVALHYANPAQNKYAYLLDGYDKHWIQAGVQRSATYTNLPPGAYTFRVKASNSDDVWTKKGDSFAFIITSPWWLRWWAWLLYILLFGATAYSLIIYRTRKLIHDRRVLEEQVNIRTEEVLQQKEEIEAQRDKLEMEKIRADIAADFHDELGSILSSISLYSEMAINDSFTDKHRTKSILSLIGDSSRNTVSAMQDMIWTIQPKNDQVKEVIYRMREYAYPLAELKKISLTINAPDDVQAILLPMDIRKNIYLVFKEALNNAFKYADAAQIDINVWKCDNLLFIQIKDDGKGFDPSVSKTGNGLINMQKRAKQTGGTLVINSMRGDGTEILLSSPIS